MSTQAELLEEHMRARAGVPFPDVAEASRVEEHMRAGIPAQVVIEEYEHAKNATPVLKLAAKRIVVLNDRGIDTFVCFEFDQASRKRAGVLHPLAVNVKIELSDTNGDFVNDREYWLLDVEVPNEGGFGGAADVLIIKAERA
jgi:hypothetical protein